MNMLKKTLLGRVLALAVASSLMLPGLLRADDILSTVDTLSQERFEGLAENLGAATHYKGVTPAEGLGTLGFDVGVLVSSTEMDEALLDEASNGSFGSSEINMARIQAHKGLPFGLDIGASMSKIIDTDISVLGAELRYSLLDGGVATPAIGVRASYSQMEGVDTMDLSNMALELTVSKGFLMFTPYAGVGIVRTEAEALDTESLESVSMDQNKMYIGLTVNLGIALTLEADQTGDYKTYTAKAGIRF